MRTINGKPIRVRGANHLRPSRKPDNQAYIRYPNGHPAKATPYAAPFSTDVLREQAAPYFDYVEVRETTADFVVPRRSYTEAHNLKLFPQTLEMETYDEPCYQIDKVTGERTRITNPRKRVVWKSDRTLLRQNKPDRLEDVDFKRVTSRSKRTIIERELPATLEVTTDDTLDGLSIID